MSEVVPAPPLPRTVFLAGCGDGISDASPNGPRMGDSDTSSDSSEDDEGTFDGADVSFAGEMIPHHRHAIQMARPAEGQAEDARVVDGPSDAWPGCRWSRRPGP